MTHNKSIHEGVKYPCDECNFKATQKGHLLTHKKSVYEGVKFPCDQCFYKATRKNHLLTHTISHLEVKQLKAKLSGFKAKKVTDSI